MAAIKRFFEKKKLDLKFKKYGDGHKLTDDTRSKDVPKNSGSTSRAAMSESAQRAGEAALVRQSQPDRRTVGQNAIKNQVRAELQAEKEAMEVAQRRAANNRENQELEASSHLAVLGVFYTCPLIGDEVLPKDQMEAKIEEYLLCQLAEVPEMASALMIHTLNKDREAVKTCVETIQKYLQNIVDNPDEDKYRKIRINNKVFQERVLKLKGAEEFIQSAGFVRETLPFQDGQCDFYVLKDRTVEEVEGSKEVLLTAEPIRAELDRGLRVLDGSNPRLTVLQNDLPDEFFAVSKEELKREQQIRREAVENLGMLRTKAMRERDEQRELRKYRFCLIRVRFPDSVILQGTFRATERLVALCDYIRSALTDDWLPFSLTAPTGHKLTDQQKTLAELGLAPAAVVSLTFDEEVTSDVTAARGAGKLTSFIKEEILALKH